MFYPKSFDKSSLSSQVNLYDPDVEDLSFIFEAFKKTEQAGWPISLTWNIALTIYRASYSHQ